MTNLLKKNEESQLGFHPKIYPSQLSPAQLYRKRYETLTKREEPKVKLEYNEDEEREKRRGMFPKDSDDEEIDEDRQPEEEEEREM